MTRTVQFLGQERTPVEEAWPGDILGVWDGGALRIGDTLVTGSRSNSRACRAFRPSTSSSPAARTR